MDDVIAAPQLVEKRVIKPEDILYTAWSRGRDKSDWMNDTRPLVDTLNKLVGETIAYDVQRAVEQGFQHGIFPAATAPKDGTYVDLWVVRHKGQQSPPERVCNARYTTYLRRDYDHNPPAENGWFAGQGGNSSRQFFDKDDLVVGWSPIPKWKQP